MTMMPQLTQSKHFVVGKTGFHVPPIQLHSRQRSNQGAGVMKFEFLCIEIIGFTFPVCPGVAAGYHYLFIYRFSILAPFGDERLLNGVTSFIYTTF